MARVFIPPRPISICRIHAQFRDFKIVYRRYAGLYFCVCVDLEDNNLAYLEAIHNFVEVKDVAYLRFSFSFFFLFFLYTLYKVYTGLL